MTDATDCAEYRALLAGVCRHPEGDLRRLVFADWLEEFGGKGGAARAEFIRVQCELAKINHVHPRLTLGGASCVGCDLAKRERDLFARHRWQWDSEALRPVYDAHRVAALTAPPESSSDQIGERFAWAFAKNAVTYSRGFPAVLRCPLAALERYAAELFRASPFLAVELTDRAPAVASHSMRFGSVGGYLFFAPEHPDGEDESYPGATLPRELFDRLPWTDDRDHFEAGFTRRSGALQALSTACVRYARSLTFPDLKEHV